MGDIQQIQLQLRGQRILTEAKAREVEQHQARLRHLERLEDERQRQLQENQLVLLANQRAIAARDQALERKERELQQTQECLRASEQFVAELQQSLQQKEKAISNLQSTMSPQEGGIQQDTANTHQPQQEPVSAHQKVVAAAQKDVGKMEWRKGKDPPVRMSSGAAIVHGNTAYIVPGCSHTVYAYHSSADEDQWVELPANPNNKFGLAIIDGLLTSVGGRKHLSRTNSLLSLSGEGKEWSEVCPPMPTPRSEATCVTTEEALVVAGGDTSKGYIDTVEVMSASTKQWTTACPFPLDCRSLSATICGDTLYLGGGVSEFLTPSKSVTNLRFL